jgi:hypothetical protein
VIKNKYDKAIDDYKIATIIKPQSPIPFKALRVLVWVTFTILAAYR